MTRKTAFFEGWSWFKFNNLGLALGVNLKFYTSVAKELKLRARKFWGLIYTFAEVTEEKPNRVKVSGLFLPITSPILVTFIRLLACNLRKASVYFYTKTHLLPLLFFFIYNPSLNGQIISLIGAQEHL